jgi:hypothetical protein
LLAIREQSHVEENEVMNRLRGALLALATVLLSNVAFAQGVQTGVLTGTVIDNDGLVLPGVSVTVTSPALQGSRTAVTDANGVYSVRGLPPGNYTVQFELAGMRTITAEQRVDLGLTARVDATMQLATLTESVTVTAELPTLVTSTTGGANYRLEEIDRLAAPRTVQGVASLAPGLTENTPNNGQITIAGGFAYDNQFLVDGVDIADNLFGNPNNLFIEDAIEEVQVLTSGISAEFGRFGGGVINAVTKSGSNRFSGSFRDNIYKPNWTRQTLYEAEQGTEREGPLQNVYEWTLGGPILRDRVWFFHAGRRQEASTPQTFAETGVSYERASENNRFELKGTATPVDNHTFQASYLRNNTSQGQPSFAFSIDPRTLVSRELPNDLWAASYRGVLTNSLFASVQVSRREFGFRNTGGTSTAILDSPFITRGFTSGVPSVLHFNAPYFDSTDPEDRNNAQIAGSLSYFATTGGLGSHDLKVGFERFVTTRTGGNSQSATGYVFNTDYLVAGGRPVLSADERFIPLFVPGQSRLENWLPTRGAQIDIATTSFYVHDQWSATPRLTFDVGARIEAVRSEATGDIVGTDTTTIVPRLAASWDVVGDGSTTVQASYAHYAGKYSETQFADNTDVGTPSLLLYEYTGPAGQGLTFAPGFDVANYRVIGGNFPTANVFFADGLQSPVTREFTVSLGRQIRDGAVRISYQQRDVNGFIEDLVLDPTAAGKVTVIRDGINFGTFDSVVYDNTDDPVREYSALILQGNYRAGARWTANAHWTVQLRNQGNFEGEAANQPGISSVIGNYPEIYTADYARNNPLGRLNDFQRHKVRAWTSYLWGFGRFGSADTSLLWRYDSPQTYSLTATVPTTAIQLARNPGYARPPQSQTLYFDERGSESYESSHLFDFAMTYQVPVFQTLRPWVKFEIYNLFNDQSLVTYNTAITADNNSPRDADGLPTGYIRGANFGRATANTNFPRATTTPSGDSVYARTFLMSFGVRF